MRAKYFSEAVIYFPACGGRRKRVRVAIGKSRRILILLISLFLIDLDHQMLSLPLLPLLRTPTLTLLGVIERNSSKYNLLLLLKSSHLVLALAMLAAFGMRLLVYLLPSLAYLFANQLLDECKGSVLECMFLDECFDLVLDIVHIIDIAQPYLTGLPLFADVYLYD
jgi:hypothetical protein